MSVHVRGGSESFEDLLHCMICFELYRSPKMLNCGHTFCKECLQGYYRTYQQQRRAQSGKIPCPTCRELTALPAGGINGLRNDFKVAKIEEMFKTVNIRKEKLKKEGRHCDNCKAQKQTNTAKFFCESCRMGYCSNCVKKHEKNPIFKNHKVTTKAAVVATEHASCRTHEGEQAKYFCRTCEQLICTMCIMNEHDGHNVIEVDELFSQHQDDVRNLQNVVTSKLERLRSRATQLEALRALNLKSCQQAEINIKQRTRDLIDSVRAQESTLLEELRRKRDAKLEEVALELDRVNHIVVKAAGLQDFANMTSARKSLRVIAMHDELVQRMRTVAEVAVNDDGDVSAVVSFLPGKSDAVLGRVDEVRGSVDELNRSPLALLPPPSQFKRRAVSASALPASEEAASPSSTPSAHVQQRARLRELVRIESAGDAAGALRDPLDVACLLNGDIVVAEWGNKRVQIFDSVGEHVGFIGKGHISPQGVSVTLRGNIIVSDASQKRLQVFTPSGTSIAKWGLGKFYAPCGIAISPNGNCIITDVAEHTVSVFQGEKKCLKRLGSRGSKDDQFNNPLYVTTGAHNEIIVSDSDNHCVKVFDSRGKFLRRIGSEGSGDGQLKYPRGIAVDQDGNIVVVDRNNDRVCLFTPQGRFVKTLLGREDGVKDPYAVAVSITRNIVLTESSKTRGAVKVFELE